MTQNKLPNSIQIRSLSSFNESERISLYSGIETIFFETSARKNFTSDQELKLFRYRYLDVYLTEPDYCFIAFTLDQSAIKILGYVWLQRLLRVTHILSLILI
jgi:hypothetical protein